MIYAIGVDSAELTRFARLLEKNRDRLLAMLFHADELAVLPEMSCKREISYIAGRWAAKEAALKAFGTGMGALSMPEIGVFTHESGQPYIMLYARAKVRAEQLGIDRWHLSITHDGGLATAFVVAECSNQPNDPSR